ncbi:unnamed protein product [Linum trigynum]|uniref:Uncharacterized protein n=1 Tax=Linum trigynum TaxID=586398 RepID=A0AAV2ECC4_9ROSI
MYWARQPLRRPTSNSSQIEDAMAFRVEGLTMLGKKLCKTTRYKAKLQSTVKKVDFSRYRAEGGRQEAICGARANVEAKGGSKCTTKRQVNIRLDW